MPRHGFAVAAQESRAQGAGLGFEDVDAVLDALVGLIVYCALTGSSTPRGLVDTLVADPR
jgi:hypothetical protein